jgi:5-methylcytosine-specific restriction endonuclease McrA
MGEQLIKQGLRRCRNCREIKVLSVETFRRDRGKKNGLGYACRSCLNNSPRRGLSEEERRRRFDKYSLKRQLVRRLGSQCNNCKMKSEVGGFFDLDHIKPIKRNPRRFDSRVHESDLPNLQVLCPNCHRLKTLKDRANHWT